MQKYSSIILGFIFCVLSFQISAQDTARSKLTERSCAAISIGLSDPINGFANTHKSTNATDFANKGFNIEVSYCEKFLSYLGLSASFRFTNNTFNASTLEYNYNNTYTNYSYSVTCQKSWGQKSFFIGPLLNLDLTKNKSLSFNLRPMIGITNATSPDIVEYATQLKPQNGFVFQQELSSASTWSLSYLISAGLNLKINYLTSVFIQCDYQRANANFNIPLTNLVATYSSATSYIWKVRMETINVNAGIRIRIR